MINQEALEEYSSSIKALKKQCEDTGMTEEEFKKIYDESLNSLQQSQPIIPNRRKLTRTHKVLLLGLLILVYLGYNYKSIYSNLQEYIYPGLKLLRHLSIPIISLFPSLTDYYHETCLLHNPFFTVVDMDCWPCSSVINVREVYDPKPVTQQNIGPFVYESDQQIMDIESLRILYRNNKNILDKESPKVLVNNKYTLKVQDLLGNDDFPEEKNLYVWQFNNMEAARVLRQYIHRPKVVPKYGQSTERFIIIDTSQESFNIPDTECSFSFLLSLSGSRTVHLKPAEECKHQCKTLKVELRESYLLWYNWWYWRPVVQSSRGNTTLVAHVGSYC